MVRRTETLQLARTRRLGWIHARRGPAGWRLGSGNPWTRCNTGKNKNESVPQETQATTAILVYAAKAHNKIQSFHELAMLSLGKGLWLQTFSHKKGLSQVEFFPP
ncbi:hypothetical protein EJB05_23786 [Eragrostis curvula]|uniref:Uncharacterized protein n=1 Tax=Eragrostis curvula TaxID=38414 RepID=A0A5J9V8X4_9POAL|nr:hypothetical protein EJB05_23786 [Eragrostis curvula]